jgi:putative inorganic carbon (HCO3(-)) transporter
LDSLEMNIIRAIAQWAAAVEFIVVAPVIAAAAVYSDFLIPALVIAALFWPLRRLVTGRWSVRTPVDWSVLLLLITLPVTLWASAVPEKTLPQVLRLLAGAALFYALVNWADPPQFPHRHRRWGNPCKVRQSSNDIRRWGEERGVRLAVDGALAAGLLLALAAPFMVQWNTLKLAFIPPALYSHFRLLVGDMVNPNVMAGSLVVLLPMGMGLLLFAWRGLKGWERLLAVTFTLVCGAILLLTQSRGAWLALAAALVVLVILRGRWGWALALAVGMAGFLLAARLGFSSVAGALVSSPTLGGLEGRLEVWSRAIYMVQDFPFTGIGMGSFTETADRLYPFFLYAPGSVEHAHNLFLQVAVDLGLPGLAAWLAILLGCSYAAWRAYLSGRQNGNPWLAGVGAGLLAVQAALVVHGLTDAVTWGMVRSAPLVWLAWAFSISAFSLSVEKRGEAILSGKVKSDKKNGQS